MADWFETKFREPIDSERPDPAFVARMRALVVEEWQAGAGATPPIDTHQDHREEDVIMLKTEDRPTGHEPGTPRRRWPGGWLLVAAAAAVIAIVGTLLVAAGDDEREVDVAGSTPTTTAPAKNVMDLPAGTSELEPGRYFVDPDGDDTTPLRVTFQVTSEGWQPWIGAFKSADPGYTSFSVTEVTNLVADGCNGQHPLDPPVGPTVDDLATALTNLAPFEVTAAPTDVNVFGYSGKHLELTVPDLNVATSADSPRFTDCNNGELRSWISPLLGGSFWGYGGATGATEEFWILDVEGTRLVLVKLDAPNAAAQDVAERDAMFDSISIEP